MLRLEPDMQLQSPSLLDTVRRPVVLGGLGILCAKVLADETDRWI